jgi:predicted Zn-dependent protease
MRELTKFRKLVLVAAMLFFTYSCAVNPVTGKKELMLMSEEQEKALGLQSDPSIIASFGLYQDEQIQAFVQEKGAQMGREKWTGKNGQGKIPWVIPLPMKKSLTWLAK